MNRIPDASTCSFVAAAMRFRSPVDPAGPPLISMACAAAFVAVRAGSPALRISCRSSLRRSVRAASRSAFVRRRYSCQSAEDWMRTLGTYASHQPFRGLLQDDPPPADPFVLRAGLHRLLQLLDGGAAGAAGLDGRVGVPVAALLRVPLVGVGA